MTQDDPSVSPDFDISGQIALVPLLWESEVELIFLISSELL